MTILDFLASNQTAFIVVIGILGLLIGSFLNVVIYRLPVILQRNWKAQCAEYLEIASAEDNAQNPKEEAFNLVVPRSRCPKCDHQITALENIPVISYLFLKGKCSDCGIHISIRYPIIEAITGLLSVVVAWQLGFTFAAAAALFLTWALVALTMIDFDHQLLPDNITLPFLWIGLLLSLANVFTDTQSSIIGAACGYMTLWSIYWLFKLVTGKEGMGFGDFKLLALFGAWFGWQYLPVIILLSSLVGAVVGISLILFKGKDKNIPIPFGPYLAAAGWIAMLWGDDIIDAYLKFSGIA